MKLDCGRLQTFEKYNQPAKGIDLEAIPTGLTKLSELSDNERGRVSTFDITFIVVSPIMLSRSYKNRFVSRKREIICQMLRGDPIYFI